MSDLSSTTEYWTQRINAPEISYRGALERYEAPRLQLLMKAVGSFERLLKPVQLAEEIADRLAEPGVADQLIAEQDFDGRLALGVLSLSGAESWPQEGLAHTLGCLGVDGGATIEALLASGLVARFQDNAKLAQRVLVSAGGPVDDATGALIVPHPAVAAAARTLLPQGMPTGTPGPVERVREVDGLEIILRLAALWQRVAEAPLRQTQQGMLYKRDRERLEDDPALAGPITDALEPLPDMTPLWLALARAVGLVAEEPGTDRIVAAPAEFWAEHAFHLPRMLALRWLTLDNWHEQLGMQEEGSVLSLALPYVRPAALLWLATLAEGEWASIEDLTRLFDARFPGWDRPALRGSPLVKTPSPGDRRTAVEADPGSGVALLDSVLLGPAYQLGLIRVAEAAPGRGRVVQLSVLGRYALALGPPPTRPASFEHFLYVQPNFEIIAYRQGLNPALIALFSRFAQWSQVGAALELKLTAESVYRGLEGGLTVDQMLDRLRRHSSRPLPPGVAEALRGWGERRERVSYYASATLMEFATSEALEASLAIWDQIQLPRPVRVSDRLLLFEQESSIPFQRFRLAGSRDYRRPPEICVEAQPDGITLGLDLSRSDLFIEAEITRFSDELRERNGPREGQRRDFRISPSTIARALEAGMTPPQLGKWFLQRTGAEIPPAVRLLLQATRPDVEPLRFSRPIILEAPTSEWLDGLLQHPATRDCFAERLGPNTAVVRGGSSAALHDAIRSLGLSIDDFHHDGSGR